MLVLLFEKSTFMTFFAFNVHFLSLSIFVPMIVSLLDVFSNSYDIVELELDTFSVPTFPL